MTRRADEIQVFKEFVRKLQGFSLDERIKQEYGKDSFRPVVHAEVQLLNWLDTTYGVNNARFFNGWKYIGTSKPTCRLCHYYFEEHKSHVQHRGTNGNLYLNWRFPDVRESQGAAGEGARQVMVDRVLLRIRKDAFDLVKQKLSTAYKTNDSNTISARITHEDGWSIATATDDGDNDDDDDLASLMGHVDLEG
jgi:hypothetical protein